MNTQRTTDYLVGLVTELRKLPDETEWVEFKQNNSNPVEIGEYISALSNAAALHGKANAYVVWGIADTTHDVFGTSFRPTQERKGQEELESWILRLLTPRLYFRFYEVTYDEKLVIVLEIPRAAGKPVQFQGVEYIRVGSYRQKLKDHSQIERELWRIFDATPFEEMKAVERITGPEVLSMLDYPSYFELLQQTLPADQNKILSRLEEERMIILNQAGGWDITNLGGILFAKNLDAFRALSRKAMRVIVYEGKGRVKTIREQVGRKGYASGFEGLIDSGCVFTAQRGDR
jgi:ATP-dependent DNA helicase RecG